MNVATLKLVTGEEFICKLLDVKDSIEVEDPKVLVQSPSGYQLVPWMMTVIDRQFSFSLKDVIFVGTTKPDLAEQYLQSTGDKKIVTPNQGIVVPE